MTITKDTYLPISLVMSIIGVALWAGVLSSKAQAASEQVQELQTRVETLPTEKDISLVRDDIKRLEAKIDYLIDLQVKK